MTVIRTELAPNVSVAGNSRQLSIALQKRSSSMGPFLNAIEVFLTDFNTRYNTEITFAQVIDIYEGRSRLEIRESIALCKSLLDFIQSHGIEVSFGGKSYALSYATLASTNATLQLDPQDDLGAMRLMALSSSISDFISAIREYFRILIQDDVRLEDAKVDDAFFSLKGIDREPATVLVDADTTGGAGDRTPGDELDVVPSSVKISDGLVIDLLASEEVLKPRIAKLGNDDLVFLLEYIYARIPYNERTAVKHNDIAKNIFIGFTPALGQTIGRILNEGSGIGMRTVEQVDIKMLKDFLLNRRDALISENGVFLLSDGLQVRPGVMISLKDNDEMFTGICGLSAEDVGIFFGYLEDQARIGATTTGSITSKLAEDLQLTDSNKASITQKINNLRNAPATITERFLKNNVDPQKLRTLIMGGETEAELDDSKKKSKDVVETLKTFEFRFGKLSDEDDGILLSVDFNGKKTKSCFIAALNSLISNELKRQDIEGLIEPLDENDFLDVPLDDGFFDNMNRYIENENIQYLFYLFDREDLVAFLTQWHREVKRKLKRAKSVYTIPGSKDELFDFVFNIWQKRLSRKVIRETRTSANTQEHKKKKRRDAVIMNRGMFEGIDKLTLDMPDQLRDEHFNMLFSKISRKEVKGWIEEYLDKKTKHTS